MATAPTRAWQRMLSGRRLDLLDPSPLDVELSDIAHGLARVARWNGQTRGDFAFSVAQHSILVHEIALAIDPEITEVTQLYAMLHDAPEYVMGDIISPFKAAMGGNYKDVENRLLGAIHVHFGIAALQPSHVKKIIKRADRDAAFFEAVNLAGFAHDEAVKIFGAPTLASFDIPNFERLIRPWPTQQAHERFVAIVDSLSPERP